MDTQRWGATTEEWAHWDLVLGLGDDLLPVVCKPGEELLSTSKLKSYGKVPSCYVDGKVCGIPHWTSHHATDGELAHWASVPNYGICLQTRDVKALDCDITDVKLAEEIFVVLRTHGTELFPVRTRADSAKFLMLVRLPGEMGKRVLKTKAGVIEFLATGQQCLVAGTHKDGQRYEWRGGLPSTIPELTLDQFDVLWSLLVRQFAVAPPTESRVARIRGIPPNTFKTDVIGDPVVEYLRGLE